MRLAILALLVTGCASTPKETSWLFVQNADRAEVNGGKLTLAGVHGTVICFTDRPERQTGTVHTTKFVEAWKDGGVFAKSPPNATLAVFEDGGVHEMVVVLRKPRLAGTDLTYEVEVLGGKPAPAGPAALFIDSVGSNTPVVRHGMHDEPGVIFRTGARLVR